jgi:hypothetical protein
MVSVVWAAILSVGRCEHGRVLGINIRTSRGLRALGSGSRIQLLNQTALYSNKGSAVTYNHFRHNGYYMHQLPEHQKAVHFTHTVYFLTIHREYFPKQH